MQIKSIYGTIHDLSYGGYPYKVIVTVELPVVEYNKLCPVVSKAESTPYGFRSARRDLGDLVQQVNNGVHALNSEIPAWNPSIDSNGGKRACKGLKRLEFVYFFQDHVTAEKLGFQILKLKNGECLPKYSQTVSILSKGEK